MVALDGGIVATLVVLGTFALLFVNRLGQYPLSRSVTAATGAVLLLGLGIVSPQRALAGVNEGTLLLLFGMLVHVAALARSGFYEWIAAWLVNRAGTPRRLTVGALGLSALLSAFALNDATVLLLTPVLVTAADRGGTDPVPPTLAVVFGANIGSVATPLGNPQNAFILASSHLPTWTFVAVLAPVALASLLVAALVLWRVAPADGTLLDTPLPDFDRRWAGVSTGFVVGTLGLLLALPAVDAGTVAAATAICHLVWLQGGRRVAGDAIFGDVDWSILVLFTGLFTLIAGLDGTALLRFVRAIDGGVELAAAAFVLSNLVSNVPAVVLLSTGLSPDATVDWLLLAATSTLAGNATPIASAATLITLELASERDVPVPLRRLLRLGVPLSVGTAVLAVGMILLVAG